MFDQEMHATSESINRVGKVCRFLGILMKFVFVVFCLVWIFGSAWIALSIFGLTDSGDSSTGVLSLVSYILFGASVAVMFIVFIGMFSDVAKGESPFSMIQVKRLRIISAMLIVYAITDIVNGLNSMIGQLGALNSGYISTTTSSAIMMVNFAPLVAAAVVFAFSFVFKYGVLLQEFSDEVM